MAALAQEWCEDCDPSAEHLEPSPSIKFEFNTTGQNVYVYNTSVSPDITEVLDSWAEERQSYDLSNNTCDDGSTCDNYLQVQRKA